MTLLRSQRGLTTDAMQLSTPSRRVDALGRATTAADGTARGSQARAQHSSPGKWFSDSPLSAPPTSPRKLTHKPSYNNPDNSSEYDEIGIMASPGRNLHTSSKRPSIPRSAVNLSSRAQGSGRRGRQSGSRPRGLDDGASDLDESDDDSTNDIGTETGLTAAIEGLSGDDEDLDEYGQREDNSDENGDGNETVEEGGEGVFEVEKILDKQGTGKEAMYRIRWKGYGPEHDSWEPTAHINAVQLVQAFEKRWQLKKVAAVRKQGSVRASSDQARSTPSKPVLTNPQRKRGRPSSDAEHQLSASVAKAIKKRKELSTPVSRPRLSLDQLFHNEAVADGDEYLLPMATVLCEPAWQQIRLLMSKAASKPLRIKKMVAVHPATIVILRTPSLPTEKTFAGRKRELLARTLQEIEDCKTPLLNTMAFPETSAFHQCAIPDILTGGEGYKLAWGEGLEDGINDEFGNLITCAMHLEEIMPHKRVRVVVRKLKPNLQAACAYFGVSIIDIEGLWHELTGR